MFKRFIFLVLFLTSLKTFSQTYGNEWINFSQKYAKISVATEGLYKITYDDIVSKNFQAGSLNPSQFQIFNKGVEVPLYITGTQDGTFDQGDVIYFYGTKNDASLDAILYPKPTDLPNSEISLFTDANCYFLTYSASNNGKRYKISNIDPSTLNPEPYILAKDRINLATNYYPGEYILDAMTLSEYIEGEGYLGDLLAKGQTVNYQLNTSEFIPNAAYKPNFSFYVAGRSNAASTQNQGKNHHLIIKNENNTLFDSIYNGYFTIRKKIQTSLNNNIYSFSISAIDDLGALTDYQAPGYFEITYARTLNLNGLNSLNFKVENEKTNALLNFSNSSISNPIIIEKNDDFLYLPTTSNGLQFVLNNSSPLKNYFLTSLNTAQSTTLNDVNFKHIIPTSSSLFLIISNQALQDGALAYQQYNQSIGMPTSIAFSDDLYNEFYYGFHHPQALRNYCSYLIDKSNTKPEYLLLLGKGYETPKGNLTNDLVPTMGFPASDHMITAGLNGSLLEPGLATGRIPAKNNDDIIGYINKLKVYRQQTNNLRRKNILQVTGGKTLFETSSFGNYQENFYTQAKSEYFGATRTQVFNNVNTPITENQTARIIDETKNGIALLSYFGHGAATGTEISFGKPTDQQNADKPAVYLVNGCSTGECFTSGNSLGEDFILVKNVGAVAWIGTTSEGVASYLGNASANYHKNWFNKFYGDAIAKGVKEGLKEFQNATDKLNKAHLEQYIYLGDPSLKFYDPKKPDFSVSNSSLFLKTTNPNAALPNLVLTLRIENIGKSLNDSLSIKVDRTLPNNSIISIPAFKIKPVFNVDSVDIVLNNVGLLVSGNNKISVKIDSDNKFDELDELNNTSAIDLFLPGNGVKNIFPLNKGIINTNKVNLQSQPDDLLTKNAEYLFEIDTMADFSSPLKKSSGVISSNLFPQWNPNLTLEDGKVYFWRSKLNLPLDKGGAWSQSSFTYISNSSDGFSESHKSQLDNLKLTNIEYDAKSGQFNFKKTFFETSIYTEGDDLNAHAEKRFRSDQSISFSDFSFQGITLVAMSNLIPNKFFSYPSPYNSTNGPVLVNGYTGQYFWNINDPVQVDSLIRFINQIPQNYHVIGFNGTNATIKSLPKAAKNALATCGLVKFELIDLGEPYMFWGIKGANPGTALEFTADYSSAIPPRSQSLQYFNNLAFPLSAGHIETEPIGPAKEWRNTNVEFYNRLSDDINYDIIGLKNNGEKDVLKTNTTDKQLDIKSINASIYPYVILKVNVTNSKLFNLPLLKQFTVDYRSLAEISFNPDSINQFYTSSISEGDSLKWNIAIKNIYRYTSDSIQLSYQIYKPNNTVETKVLSKIAPLKPAENYIFKIKENTLGNVGKSTIKLNFDGFDIYNFNNHISYDYEVRKDVKEPILSVLFDGKNIINGEIISPKPLITIKTTDENKFLLLKDTSMIDIYIKKETEANYHKIYFSNPQIKFSSATSLANNSSIIEYQPNFSENGKYELKVKTRDASGNYNQNDYLISFEVINESTISNFYPYPNPVVNSMRFVFTLTGVKVPDNIKITIYNSTGKIIRTILKSELGNIKIGNNISDFTWDGTDEFGDRLANGVYFYNVDISDSSNFNKRKTAGDNYFKNNKGKIYLLR